jgi:hypothetical protein
MAIDLAEKDGRIAGLNTPPWPPVALPSGYGKRIPEKGTERKGRPLSLIKATDSVGKIIRTRSKPVTGSWGQVRPLTIQARASPRIFQQNRDDI